MGQNRWVLNLVRAFFRVLFGALAWLLLVVGLSVRLVSQALLVAFSALDDLAHLPIWEWDNTVEETELLSPPPPVFEHADIIDVPTVNDNRDPRLRFLPRRPQILSRPLHLLHPPLSISATKSLREQSRDGTRPPDEEIVSTNSDEANVTVRSKRRVVRTGGRCETAAYRTVSWGS